MKIKLLIAGALFAIPAMGLSQVGRATTTTNTSPTSGSQMTTNGVGNAGMNNNELNNGLDNTRLNNELNNNSINNPTNSSLPNNTINPVGTTSTGTMNAGGASLPAIAAPK